VDIYYKRLCVTDLN